VRDKESWSSHHEKPGFLNSASDPTPDTALVDRAALETLAAWCDQFSPTAGLEESDSPESLLLDITGLAPLFHGEEALAELVVQEFERRGYNVSVTVADTLGAAWAAAHYRQEEIGSSEESSPSAIHHSSTLQHSLPVEALRLTTETIALLRELGLTEIGQLLALPRASLASRFGRDLVLRLAQFLGEAPEMIRVCHPPPVFQAEDSFEEPTGSRQMIELLLERQVEQVARSLSARQEGARQLVCRLRCASDAVVAVSVGLFQPSAAARHLFNLLHTRLERLALSEPVSAVGIEVTATDPLECRQQELFTTGTQPDAPRQLAMLIDRLSSRLGREAVLCPSLRADAQPEFAWTSEPLTHTRRTRSLSSYPLSIGASRKKKSPRRKRQAPPHFSMAHSPFALSRPLFLAPRPLPLAVISIVPDGPPLALRWLGEEQRIARHWGPERIETGWWRHRGVRRDYYRVETTAGQRYWLFRRLPDGQWFLHGWFE
jgi:protein ImuB